MSKNTVAQNIKLYDSLQNLLTGMGIDGVDKTTGRIFVDYNMSWNEMENAYSSDWLSGLVCRTTPFDMVREWRKFDGTLQDDPLLDFEDVYKRHLIKKKLMDSMVWGNVYGGCGLVINVDDGRKPNKPLNMDTIKRDGLRFIRPVDAQFLRPRIICHDAWQENYGYPDTYSIAHSATEVHHTRVIRFNGLALPLQGRRRNGYWGKSLIEHIGAALRNAAAIQQGVGTIIEEASVDTLSVSNLMDLVSSPEGTKALEQRLGLMKLQKSINRMAIIDTEETLANTQQQFINLDAITQQYLAIVAAAADVPVTRMLGTSPGGFDSTGSGDLINYYDAIHAKQEIDLKPKLEKLDEIVYRSVFGRAPKRGELTFKFKSLFQMNPKDQSEADARESERDQRYIIEGVLTPSIVAKKLQDKDDYLAIDETHLKKLEKNEKEAQRLKVLQYKEDIDPETGTPAIPEEPPEELGGDNKSNPSKKSTAGPSGIPSTGATAVEGSKGVKA